MARLLIIARLLIVARLLVIRRLLIIGWLLVVALVRLGILVHILSLSLVTSLIVRHHSRVEILFLLLFLGRVVGITSEIRLLAFFESLHDSSGLKDTILSLLLPIWVKRTEKCENIDEVLNTFEVDGMLLGDGFDCAFFFVNRGEDG